MSALRATDPDDQDPTRDILGLPPLLRVATRPGQAELRRTPDGVLWLSASAGGFGGQVLGEIEGEASWARIGDRFTAVGGRLPPEAVTVRVVPEAAFDMPVAIDDGHWLVACTRRIDRAVIDFLDRDGQVLDRFVVE